MGEKKGKDEKRIADEATLKLARDEFAPVLKKLELETEERNLIAELEKGLITPQDATKVRKLRELILKYQDTLEKKLAKEKKKKEIKELLDRFENLRVVIQTEKELLEALSPQERTVEIDTGDFVLEFSVKPLEPGDDLSIVNVDEGLLEKISTKERLLLRKGRAGQLRSKKEKEQYELLLAKMEQNRLRHFADEAHKAAEFLATFLSPPDDFEKAYDFWMSQTVGLRTVAVIKTIEALGLSDRDVNKLFQLNRISRI